MSEPTQLKRTVGELYGRHQDETIYVVGSGASMRVFPRGVLEGKIVIGLNMAWKIAPVTYGITIHPDLNIPEYMAEEEERPEITWIIGGENKARKLLTEEHFENARARAYWFEYRGQENTAGPGDPGTHGRMLDWVRQPDPDHLYVWSSISQTGMNLAANLGARTIILVGCDCRGLARNHHAHRQHTRWNGVEPDYRYRQYYEGMAEVRDVLRERGVEVLSLTPFIGLDAPEADFERLCGERGVEGHIESVDVSPAPKKGAKRSAWTALKSRVKGLLGA